jgi:hypothetical protein
MRIDLCVCGPLQGLSYGVSHPSPSHNAAVIPSPLLLAMLSLIYPNAQPTGQVYKYTACMCHEAQMLREMQSLIERKIIKFILEVINFMMLVT